MYYVVNRAGTAVSIKNAEIVIAGKTGTAQNPQGKPHAVFVAFAPYNNPKIAVAVIVENAGFGSVAAAPVARDMIKAYLQKGKKEIKPLEIANISKGQESNKIAN
jgi:cell division protein FtsI/penicillin-binding protein 2